MRAVGAMLFPIIGKIVDKTTPFEQSNVFGSAAVSGAIANDSTEDEASVSGGWANTLVLYTGWTAVLFLIIGYFLCKVLPKKYARKRRRPMTRKRRTTTRSRRTYKRRKK